MVQSPIVQKKKKKKKKAANKADGDLLAERSKGRGGMGWEERYRAGRENVRVQSNNDNTTKAEG
jgi:hypothetical protein